MASFSYDQQEGLLRQRTPKSGAKAYAAKEAGGAATEEVWLLTSSQCMGMTACLVLALILGAFGLTGFFIGVDNKSAISDLKHDHDGDHGHHAHGVSKEKAPAVGEATTQTFSTSATQCPTARGVHGPWQITGLGNVPLGQGCLRMSANGEQATNSYIYPNLHGENWLAVNPLNRANMVVAAHQGYMRRFLSDAIYYSNDCGRTWAQADVQWSRCQAQGSIPGSRSDWLSHSDPFVAFDGAGRAHFTGLGFNIGPDSEAGTAAADEFVGEFEEAVTHSYSTDGGVSWTPLTHFTRDNAEVNYQEFGAITPSRFDMKVLYAVYNEWACSFSDTPCGAFTFRSIDGGVTWQPRGTAVQPLAEDPQGYNSWGSQIFETAPGKLWLFLAGDSKSDYYYDSGDKSIISSCASVDDGLTWSCTPFAQTVTGSIFDPLVPSVTMTGTGGLSTYSPVTGRRYVLFTTYACNAAQPETIVYVSNAAGTTWTGRRIEVAGRKWMNFANIATDSQGNVGVVYYDLRNAVNGTGRTNIDLFFAVFNADVSVRYHEYRLTPISMDYRGTIIRSFTQVSGSPVPNPAFWLTDYIGLQATGKDFAITASILTDNQNQGYSEIPTGIKPDVRNGEQFPTRIHLQAFRVVDAAAHGQSIGTPVNVKKDTDGPSPCLQLNDPTPASAQIAGGRLGHHER